MGGFVPQDPVRPDRQGWGHLGTGQRTGPAGAGEEESAQQYQAQQRRPEPQRQTHRRKPAYQRGVRTVTQERADQGGLHQRDNRISVIGTEGAPAAIGGERLSGHPRGARALPPHPHRRLRRRPPSTRVKRPTPRRMAVSGRWRTVAVARGTESRAPAIRGRVRDHAMLRWKYT